MRDELKKYDWHCYGLTISDFEYTFEMVMEMIADRQSQLRQKVKNIEVYGADGRILSSSDDGVNEAIDDLAYYSFNENLNIWHFCLWRLQGIFEGILQQEFFQDVRLNGLKAKLNYVRKLGYSINQFDYDEIIEWGMLRNALSHYPPEQFNTVGLSEEDVKEYLTLVSRVVDSLLKQKI